MIQLDLCAFTGQFPESSHPFLLRSTPTNYWCRIHVARDRGTPLDIGEADRRTCHMVVHYRDPRLIDASIIR
jgi:hypothetical protein